MSEHRRMWGRGEELGFLQAQLSKSTSATILHGDPQIGKSMLARQFVGGLRAKSSESCRVGFYKAVASPHDPFVFAIADLLRDVYAWGHVADQLRLLPVRLREVFSIKKLKDLLLTVWRALDFLPGMKPPRELAEWLLKELEGVDLTVTPPSMTAHDIAKILATLSEACPSLRFVLVVDDYSLPYEILGSHQGLPWDYGTLLHLVSERLSRVHVVITWKDNSETSEQFDKLRSFFLQYGGNLLRLRPLPVTKMLAWVREELPVLAVSIGEAQLLTLVDGLPKVAAELVATGISNGPSAQQLANEIKTGSYDYLHRFLRQCPDAQRDLLLYMAIDESSMQPSGLAELTGLDQVEVVRNLKLAVEQNLLLQVAPDTFLFEHDVKRRIVLDHLFRFHMASAYLTRVLRYIELHVSAEESFLSAYAIARAGLIAFALAREDGRFHSTADFYLRWILDAWRSPLEILCAQLEQLTRHEGFRERPDNIKAKLLFELFAGAIEIGEGSRVSDASVAATSTLLQLTLPNKHGLVDALAAAKTCTAYLGLHHCTDALEGFLPALVRVAANRLELSPEAITVLGRTLTNMAIAAARPEYLRQVVVTHRQLLDARPDVADLRESFAQTIVNAVHHTICGAPWINEVVSDLALLWRVEPITPALAEACIRGIHDAAVVLDQLGSWESTETLLMQAKELFTLRSGDEQVVKWYSRMLSNCTAYFGRLEAYDEAIRAARELEAIAATHEKTPGVITDYGQALDNLATLAWERRDAKLMGDTVNRLRSCAVAYDQNAEVALHYMTAMQKASWLFTNAHDDEQLRVVLDCMQKYERTQCRGELAAVYVEAILNAVGPSTERLQLEPEKWREFHVQVSEVADRYPAVLEVCQKCAAALANVVAIAAMIRQWELAQQATTRVREIVAQCGTDQETSSHYGRALFVGYVGARTNGERDIAESYRVQAREHSPYVKQVFDDFLRKWADCGGPEFDSMKAQDAT